MKTQLKFQKILTMVSLIISALVFVYGLIFFSGNLSGDGLLAYINDAYGDARVDYKADGFLQPAQTFNKALIIIAIVGILVAVTLFITSCNTRRNYYVTNYVAIGLNVVMGLVVAMFLIINISILMSYFYGKVDWDAIFAHAESRKEAKREYADKLSKSPAIFIIGYVVSILTLANAAAWILNLIWKLKLMKGEKQLLQNGLVKEVA